MTLPGNFAVNATGGATYTIPISVPPGRAGMTPALSLSYSSQNPNGLLGVGWSLGGLPSIGRCPQTMAQDGAIVGINYSATDRFCLEGQRLIAISGGYGADGSEYRTEIDSYARILSHGSAGTGPAWFEIHTKSGQVMEFGHTADSQILAQGKATARSWAVDKVSDSKGNYFTVTYVNDATNGQAYPSRIDYTGNAAANLATHNSVQFVYATRPDINPQYQGGSLSRTTVRLTDITTYAVGEALVGHYKLVYQQSATTSASELQSILLCSGDGSCLPATSFEWQDGGTGFSNPAFTSGNGFDSSGAGDGPGLIALDLNGDGKTDLVQAWNDGGLLKLITYISNGDGTFSGRVFATGQGFDSMGAGKGPGLLALDLNGDGRVDLVQQWNNAETLWLISYTSSGDGTFAVPTGWFNTGQGFDSMGAGKGPELLVLDVNGDGKGDLVQQWNNVETLWLIAYISNGDGTFALPAGWFNTGQGFDSTGTGEGPGLLVLDVNGDGKTDLVQQWNNAETLWLISYISSGDGTFAVPTGWFNTGQGFDSTGAGKGPGLYALDLNGDGKADLVQQWNSSGTLLILAYLSAGDGTFSP